MPDLCSFNLFDHTADIGIEAHGHTLEEAFENDKVEIMSLADIGLPPEQVGETGSGTKVLSMKQVSRKRKCEMLEGTVEQQSDELIDHLKRKGILG